MTNDAELLRRYAEESAGEAFAELVQRHLGLVYHTALRLAEGDPTAAREMTQRVFTALAQHPAEAVASSDLLVWLHARTREVRKAWDDDARRPREVAGRSAHGAAAASATGSDWDRLQPVIDEALEGLDEREREAVLLRFFEGRPFSEIGDTFFLTEDAARVRVNRAVEKLEAILARRGVSSSGESLTIALEQFAGGTVPAGLAASIIAGALSGAPPATRPRRIRAERLALAAAITLALVAIGIAVHQARRATELNGSLALAQQNAADLRVQLEQVQARLAAEVRRAQAADEDNAQLIEAMDRLAAIKLEEEADRPEPGETVTPEMVSVRFRHAGELARTGQYAEALVEYLWCYDEGMPRFATFYGVRTSFLLAQIADLAKRHPPARDALRQRRDQAEARMRASATDREAAAEVAALNDALGESARTFAAFEMLRPDDPRRQELGARVFGTLVARKRYREAVQARDYAQMRGLFELTLSSLEGSGATGRAEGSAEGRAAAHADLLRNTARDIEALAGAGEVAHARELASRVLEFDGSPEARALLQEHVARAGQPELLRRNDAVQGGPR